jgi:hypothetical protein
VTTGVDLGLPLIGPRVRLEPGEAGSVTILDGGGARAGTIEIEDEGSSLFVRSLCIDVAMRGFGLGSEAARLLRGAAEDGPWTSVRAWAPPGEGLAVYFWFRMGFRPLHGEGPGGGLLLERRTGA